MSSLALFRNHIIEAPGVLDPEGVHRKFVSGMHGRKLDFDSIPTKSSLFEEWADMAAQTIRRLYSGQALGARVLLSVANGTNRLVQPVADRLNEGAKGAELWTPLQTEKVSPGAVRLTTEAKEAFEERRPDFVLALEDVGTRGTTSASAILAARKAGAERAEALNTWQRRPELEELVGIGVVYNAIIHQDLPTLSPEECRAAGGYCAQGWELVEHPK